MAEKDVEIRDVKRPLLEEAYRIAKPFVLAKHPAAGAFLEGAEALAPYGAQAYRKAKEYVSKSYPRFQPRVVRATNARDVAMGDLREGEALQQAPDPYKEIYAASGDQRLYFECGFLRALAPNGDYTALIRFPVVVLQDGTANIVELMYVKLKWPSWGYPNQGGNNTVSQRFSIYRDKPGTPWYMRNEDCIFDEEKVIYYNTNGGTSYPILQQENNTEVYHVADAKGNGRIIARPLLTVRFKLSNFPGGSGHEIDYQLAYKQRVCATPFFVANHIDIK